MMEDWGFDDATNHNCIHVRMMAMQPANEAKKKHELVRLLLLGALAIAQCLMSHDIEHTIGYKEKHYQMFYL